MIGVPSSCVLESEWRWRTPSQAVTRKLQRAAVVRNRAHDILERAGGDLGFDLQGHLHG